MREIGRTRQAIVTLLALIGLVSFGVLKAQNPNFTQFKVDDGLPSSEIYGSFEDRKGFMWFATEYGVSRFDGYEFLNFSTDDGLSDNVVFDFFEDSKDRLWFYTYNGIPSYYKDGEIVNFSTHPSFRNSNHSEMISSIFEDIDGTIWMGKRISGLIEISPEDSLKTHILNHPHPLVNSQVSPLGHFWSPDSVLHIFAGRILLKFNREERQWDLLEPWIPADFSTPIFWSKIPFGLVIARKPDIFKLGWEGNKVKIEQLTSTPNSIPSTCIVRINDDECFVGTYKGMYKYQLSTNSWGPTILEGYSVTSACQDREGNYWFTTLSNGIFYTPGIDVKHWGQSEGFSTNGIKKILHSQTSDDVWVGMMDNNIARFNKGTIQNISINFPDSSRFTGPLELISDNGKILICSASGLTWLDPESKKQKHLVVPGALKSVFRTSKGQILVCGNNGLYSITDSLKRVISSYPTYPFQMGQMIHHKAFANNRICDERVYSVLELGNGELLLGTSKGVIQVKENLKNHRLFDDHPSMQFAVYNMALGHDGSAWVATHGGGIVHLVDDTLVQYDTRNGIKSNLCKTVYIEPSGTVWVGSNQGISSLLPSKESPGTYTISSFSTLDGLTSDEVNDLVVKNDTLWLASPKGLSCIPLKMIDRVSPPPMIYLDSLTVNNQPLTIDRQLEFEPDENNLGIHFIGVSYQSQGNITYSYRLIGADDTWNTTNNNSVDFLGLSPGDYIFEVFATNFKGIRSDQTLQLSFTILQPWYLRWWAIALGLGLTILVIYLFINRRYRVMQIRNDLQMDAALSEQKALRARIAPHFIYNALNSIQSLISDNQRIEALNYTSRFSRLMRKIFEHSLENFISIEEEIETLEIYLKLEHLRFKDKFTYKIEVDPELDPSADAIPSMILQPIIENSIWHGLLHKQQPGHLKVKFQSKGELLQCVIEDNGIGRKAAQAQRSKFVDEKRDSGLEVTKGRLQTLAKLEGKQNEIKMEIIDMYDEEVATGTRVEVWLPFKHIEQD